MFPAMLADPPCYTQPEPGPNQAQSFHNSVKHDAEQWWNR